MGGLKNGREIPSGVCAAACWNRFPWNSSQSLTASIIHATATHEGRRQHLAREESPELRTPRPEISQNVHVSGLPSAAFLMVKRNGTLIH